MQDTDNKNGEKRKNSRDIKDLGIEKQLLCTKTPPFGICYIKQEGNDMSFETSRTFQLLSLGLRKTF